MGGIPPPVSPGAGLHGTVLPSMRLPSIEHPRHPCHTAPPCHPCHAEMKILRGNAPPRGGLDDREQAELRPRQGSSPSPAVGAGFAQSAGMTSSAIHALSRLLLLPLLICSAGCSPSAVEIHWTLAGGTCLQRSLVKTLTLQLHEQNTNTDRQYVVPCFNAGMDGVVLEGIPNGVYHAELLAKTGDGSVVFEWQALEGAEFDEHRTTPLNVDLKASRGPLETFYLSWDFGTSYDHPRVGCDEAGITQVSVVVDGRSEDVHSYDCHRGEAGMNAISLPLSHGLHDFLLSAKDAAGVERLSSGGGYLIPETGLVYGVIEIWPGPPYHHPSVGEASR